MMIKNYCSTRKSPSPSKQFVVSSMAPVILLLLLLLLLLTEDRMMNTTLMPMCEAFTTIISTTTKRRNDCNLVNSNGAVNSIMMMMIPPHSISSSIRRLSTSTSLSSSSTSTSSTPAETTTSTTPPLNTTTTITTSTTTTAAATTTTHHRHQPIFDFSLSNPITKQKSARSFERIDDAIMGGISTSTLRDVPNQSYAIWSGICRTDGGGFCGVRTLPFANNNNKDNKAALNATGMEGMYMDCRLVSDDEAERRVWKMTVRTDSSRGELVYQAEYDLQRAMEEAKTNNIRTVGEEKTTVDTDDDDDDIPWARVLIPFENFQQVRGPRLVPDGPKLDVSGGIYQIGLTLSKFKMARNTTEMENFRPGYFELRIHQIGFYQRDENNIMVTAEKTVVSKEEDTTTISLHSLVPDTLSKEEAAKKRPLLLKLLLPMAKLFFSEQANRRKSAMRILREDRNMSRFRAIMFGVQYRKKSGVGGMLSSMIQTLSILSVDTFRAVVKNALKVAVVYPLRLVGVVVTMVKKLLGMKVKPSLRE